MQADLKLIELALSRNRNLKITIGVALALLGLTALVSVPNDHREGIGPLTWVASAAIIFGTGFAGLSILRHDVSKHEIAHTIRRNPERVVWVYYYRLESMPYGIRVARMCTLYLQLQNGRKLGLQASEHRITAIMDALRDRLPHATFGYSKEKEQLYRANPDLLRK